MNVTGTLMRKLRNSASRLSKPRASSTAIVMPDRLKPGIAAKPCAMPATMPSIGRTSWTSCMPDDGCFIWMMPVTIMNAPTTAMASAPMAPETSCTAMTMGSAIEPLVTVVAIKNSSKGVGFSGCRRKSAASFWMVFLKTIKAANAVPRWSHIAYKNASLNVIPNKSVATAVTEPSELTGIHSVMPCTMPRTIASSKLSPLPYGLRWDNRSLLRCGKLPRCRSERGEDLSC